MSAEPDPQASPVFDPQTWIDLLTVHGLRGDIFSARTLTVIHEGVEKLAAERQNPGSHIVLTAAHVNLFERFHKAFNNPNLLKEVGAIYLEEFRIPTVALKHIDLAAQLAPRDRDIEQLQVAAALAVARQVTEQSGHSGIDEDPHAKHEVGELIRKTSKLAHVTETREQLGETAGELGVIQELRRKTDALKPVVQHADYHRPLRKVAGLMEKAEFTKTAAALEDAQKLGAPNEELQAYYAQLGLAAYDYNRMDDALSAFLRMRELGPKAVEGWFNCGLVLQKMGRLDEALAAYLAAARIAPENSKTFCNLSSAHFERSNFEEAEKAARRAIQLRPDYARAWDNLASALSAQNRLTEAAEACQKAIHIQPALHSAWFKYGVVNFQLDNMRMATEAFNMTGDNPDFFPYVLYYASMIDARKGEFETAVEKLAAARVADPANELEIAAVKELGAAFLKAGNYPEAANYYGQITKKQPNDFSAWLAFGTACHRAGQNEQAQEAYARSAQLKPSSPLPWHNMGLLASDLGKREEARDCFQKEVELAPADAKAWYDYGVSLQALGDDVESSHAFEQAENLVKSLARRSSDLSAALSIVRRLNLSERVLKTE